MLFKAVSAHFHAPDTGVQDADPFSCAPPMAATFRSTVGEVEATKTRTVFQEFAISRWRCASLSCLWIASDGSPQDRRSDKTNSALHPINARLPWGNDTA